MMAKGRFISPEKYGSLLVSDLYLHTRVLHITKQGFSKAEPFLTASLLVTIKNYT